MLNISKVVMAGTMAVTFATFGTQAADQGQGVINFKGSVIDAPCGIEPESADQSIDFGQLSKANLEAAGTSGKKDLSIKLVNCDKTAIGKLTSGVKVLFSGTTVSGQTGELGTAGDTGTAIVISGQDGKMVTFGTASSATTLSGTSGTLRYTTWVKRATGTKDVSSGVEKVTTIKEGDFSAVANFNLIYE